MRLCDLKQKEVINTRTCRCLGYPCDIDFCIENNKICSLILPYPGQLFHFRSKKTEYIIPWNCICKIGDDIILVDIKEEECLSRDLSFQD